MSNYTRVYVAKNVENQSAAALDPNQNQMKEQFWANEQVRTMQMADRRRKRRFPSSYKCLEVTWDLKEILHPVSVAY